MAKKVGQAFKMPKPKVRNAKLKKTYGMRLLSKMKTRLKVNPYERKS